MSKIVAIMPMRNEAWCIGLVARALLQWVDELMILDHASTDDSRGMAYSVSAENPDRVLVDVELNPVWEEMRHRQSLLEHARGFTFNGKTTHIVTVDADEVLTANLLPNIRSYVLNSPFGQTMQLPWIQLRGSINIYHASGMWAEQDVSTAFLDEPRCHWAARDGYHFHHRHPMGRDQIPYLPLGPAFAARGKGGLMHLQMVSDRRLRAKQALYVMQEVVRWPGRSTPEALNAMYGPTVYGGAVLADVTSHSSNGPRFVIAQPPELGITKPEWWAGYEPLMKYLDIDAKPWQEAECKKLWDEHGAGNFRGLDLFGVL